jgi:putative flippase GtrA
VTPFIRFNIVGIIGFTVQMGVLAALSAMDVSVLPATCLSVEAAILHNFVWHEHWTWPRMGAGSRTARLARFHVSNGLVSMAGNATMTTGLVHIGVPLLVASLAAVLTCALVNFATANLWVFCAKTWPTFHGQLH